MSRRPAGVCVLAALVASLTVPAFAFATPLNLRDVPAGDPDRIAIEFLNRHEVIAGYPDGTFHPDANITRGEILKIALEAAGEGRAALLAAQSAGGGYSDVPATHTLGTYISYASGHGYISGYPDGTFRPDNNVTRAEAAKILANVLKAPAGTFDGYTDIKNSTLRPFMETVAAANWYRPAPPIFNAAIPITRREVAQAAYRALVATNADPSRVYASGMTEPTSEPSDWTEKTENGISFALPAGWDYITTNQDVNGIPMEFMATGPLNNDNTEPTFLIVSVNGSDIAKNLGALENGLGNGNASSSAPETKQVAVDGASGPRMITVVEQRVTAQESVMLLDGWLSGDKLYFAVLNESYAPGMTGTFYRFVQHAIELNASTQQ